MSHTPGETANALAGETSPYLLQHAANPVAWYPWGPEALERAAREDRPILLSIGYSACHWCHVMAHESFEDEASARLMNRLFINIKVDREERPDLDRIYQRSHQLLTGRPGGWPLTVFLTPRDHVPFFAGTYFPPRPRFGLPGFAQVLEGVAAFYRDHRDRVEEQNRELLAALRSLDAPQAGGGRLSAATLQAAQRELEGAMDREHGGFGRAPKFPHPGNLERLLRAWARGRRQAGAAATASADRALDMAVLTLRRMAEGGLFDQIGGGFCRYSVDEQWMIPHFEKMLYDNGALMGVYAQAFAATADPLFARVCEQIHQWLQREMVLPGGGFCSSLDADSGGEEGRYYLWDRAEAKALLAPLEYEVFARRYGLDRAPNFEGRWYPHTRRPLDQVARSLELEPVQARAHLEAARERLLAARARRVAPGRDDKVVTSWNALMIRGLALAARHLGDSAFARSAERALDFILAELWDGQRLLATWKDGRAGPGGYLDDHAFLADAILELLQVRWRAGDLDVAVALAEALLERFEDRERGGFYFTPHDHEPLIHRPRPFADESIPSGNGVAARVLLRLGHVLGEERYLRAAERTLDAAAGAIEAAPSAHGALLDALEEHLQPPELVILRGPAPELPAWWAPAARAWAPGRLVLAIPADARGLRGVLADTPGSGDHVTAHICDGGRCAAPTGDRGAYLAALGEC